MPPRKKGEDKVGTWLRSNTKLDQEDPYDAEADEMAPHSQQASSVEDSIQPTQRWPEYLEEMTRAAFSASTKRRTEAWEHIASVVDDDSDPLKPEHLVDVVALALETAPRYTDRSSRLIVLSTLRAALARQGQPDTPAIRHAVAHLKKDVDQAAKVTTAGSYAAALSIRISLVSFVLTTFSAVASFDDAAPSSPVWAPLVQVMAVAFDSVVGDESPKARSSIRNVLVLARRTVREVSIESGYMQANEQH